MAVKIFFCYAHEDEALLKRLKTHLRPLQREGLIDIWCDRDISPGADWEREITQELNTAQIIILLVSPDFMESDYCYSIEMRQAMERHERGETHVLPVILRPVYWQGTLGKLQALPTDARPVTDPDWHNLDRAFFDIAESIRKITGDLIAKTRWLDISKIRYQAMLCEEALAACNQALQIDPSFVEAYKAKGDVLRDIERYEEALSAYERVIALMPSYMQAWYEKGDILRKLSRSEEAVAAFEKVIEIDPTNVWAWQKKGQVLRDLKNYEGSLAAYDQALQISPDLVDIHLDKGRIYLDLERYNDALGVYEQATQVAFNNTWIWHDKGVALTKLGHAEEALVAFEQAIKLDLENRWAWLRKAEILEYLAERAREKAKQLDYKEVAGSTPLVQAQLNILETPLHVIVIGDDDAAIHLYNQLASTPTVQRVTFRLNESKAWNDIHEGNFNTIFIDPFCFDLDNTSRFIFRVRREYPKIVFVLHIDLKDVESDKNGFYQGERRRFEHYFTLEKGLPPDKFPVALKNVLSSCMSDLHA